MLPAIAASVIGAVTGALFARRRKGTAADMAQYAAVFALIFGLAGLFLAIAVARLAA